MCLRERVRGIGREMETEKDTEKEREKLCKLRIRFDIGKHEDGSTSIYLIILARSHSIYHTNLLKQFTLIFFLF